MQYCSLRPAPAGTAGAWRCWKVVCVPKQALKGLLQTARTHSGAKIGVQQHETAVE